MTASPLRTGRLVEFYKNIKIKNYGYRNIYYANPVQTRELKMLAVETF